MRLVFFGSGAFGLPTLAHLAHCGKHDIAAIVTQPDKPAGRGGNLTPTPIAAWAAENLPGVPILKPPKVNAPEIIAEIHRLAAAPSGSSHPTSDIPHPTFVVIAFGQKLSTRLLENAFAINLHASLLPRWRGAAPINAAILAGDKLTGNSIITLADRMDAGLILAQTDPPIQINPHHCRRTARHVRRRWARSRRAVSISTPPAASRRDTGRVRGHHRHQTQQVRWSDRLPPTRRLPAQTGPRAHTLARCRRPPPVSAKPVAADSHQTPARPRRAAARYRHRTRTTHRPSPRRGILRPAHRAGDHRTPARGQAPDGLGRLRTRQTDPTWSRLGSRMLDA